MDSHQVSYQWIDVSKDEKAMRYVQKVNKGLKSIPVIEFPDVSRLVEPADAELAKKLESAGWQIN